LQKGENQLEQDRALRYSHSI